jgi:hypothetical protein
LGEPELVWVVRTTASSKQIKPWRENLKSGTGVAIEVIVKVTLRGERGKGWRSVKREWWLSGKSKQLVG